MYTRILQKKKFIIILWMIRWKWLDIMIKKIIDIYEGLKTIFQTLSIRGMMIYILIKIKSQKEVIIKKLLFKISKNTGRKRVEMNVSMQSLQLAVFLKRLNTIDYSSVNCLNLRWQPYLTLISIMSMVINLKKMEFLKLLMITINAMDNFIRWKIIIDLERMFVND